MTDLPLAEVRVGRRSRRDLGDVDSLAASIASVGLLHPIVVDKDRRLIAGRRRLEAVRQLGWPSVSVTVADSVDDALSRLLAERDENTCRKDMTPSEAVALADVLEPLERKGAKARQRAGGRAKVPQTLGKHSGETARRIGAAVGMSAPTLERAREIVRAAEKDPRLGPLVSDMDRTGRVNGAYRRLEHARAAEKVAALPPTGPAGPFGVVVADPPWAYTKRNWDVTHRATLPYPSMTLEEIAAVRVPAADDAILWLWTTNAHQEYAYGVARAWGFEPKTALTWCKQKMGVGDWLRGQTEHCILAVRGHPPVRLTNQTTVLHAAAREHSRKPDEFFALVESLCPDRRRLEMFARKSRPGWACVGAELAASGATRVSA